MRSVTAAEANRRFSELLRAARDGETILVTSRGRPVAKLVPVEAELDAKVVSRKSLVDRLRAEPALDLPRISRDELYEDRTP
ncbi:MAG TPA: type II toxin-antitoxin system prevent-host-death family antitoxin [Azospirillaceae bacterium]|nr:type II toxin-antitoxin system prevent-host-death family antitoxin [Azospirillaceae bacterium]